MSEVTIIAVFFAGLLSFVSPCILPLIPGFLGYLAGISPNSNTKSDRLYLFINTVFYVLGFTFIFAIVGVLLNAFLTTIAYDAQTWFARIGGVIIILFGLYLLSNYRPKFLQKEYKITPKKRYKSNYLTSFVFGAAFALGWSPCVGIILASVLTIAATQPGLSFILLLAYALGLGIPFLLVGAFSTQAISLLKKMGPWYKYFNATVAIFLILLGALILTQNLVYVANLDFITSIFN